MDVLVLEDNAILSEVFADSLRNQGFTVWTAGSISDAKLIVFGVRPEVAVLDLMVDGESSLDLAALMSVLTPKCELIIVTGSELYPYAELFHMNTSVSFVLRKPVDLEHLTSSVEHVAKRCRAGEMDSEVSDCHLALAASGCQNRPTLAEKAADV